MKLVKNVYKFSLVLLLGLAVFTSCSEKLDERDAETATSALINTNKHIVAYGHLSIEEILNKINYKSIPLANALIGTELDSWKEGLVLDKPVYYALQAPFAKDGTPAASYGLVNVKDEAKLIDKFNQMGFAVEKSGEITYFSDNDVTVGVRKKLAVIVSKKAPYDGKAAIEEAFRFTEGDESEGTTKDILRAKGDILNGVNIDRLFATSNTSLNKLDPAKKEELAKLVADAQVQTAVHFDKGELRIESKNHFSDELTARLFFKEDNGAGAVKKLNGNAWMGVSSNIDVRKLEDFLNDFLPEHKAKMNQHMAGPAALVLSMAGDNPFTQLFSGQFALIATGKPTTFKFPIHDLLMDSEFNFFLGAGTKGGMLADLVEGGASLKGFPQQGDAYILHNKVAVVPKTEGIYGRSLVSTAQGKATVPSFAKSFGKNSFCMFIDFTKMDLAAMQLPKDAEVIGLMESFVINVDEKGGELVLKMKNSNENVLSQIAHFYAGMAEQQMNGGDFAME